MVSRLVSINPEWEHRGLQGRDLWQEEVGMDRSSQHYRPHVIRMKFLRLSVIWIKLRPLLPVNDDDDAGVPLMESYFDNHLEVMAEDTYPTLFRRR